MPIKITTTWEVRPGSIWAKLAERLGREPTAAEASEEVCRILREGRDEPTRQVPREKRRFR